MSRLPGRRDRLRRARGVLGGFIRKETRHILRDRQTLFVLLALPLVEVLLFGFVIRTDVENVRVGFVIPAPDAATAGLVARFRGSDLFSPVGTWPSADRLPALFEQGRIDQAVVFEPGFAGDLGRGRAHLLVVTDASDPNTGSAMSTYAEQVIRGFERDAAGGAAISSAGGSAPRAAVRIEPRIRVRFDPTLESRNLFVPGLIALVLTIVSALMTSIAITREKERGTMEVLLVSPLRPWQIIVGKVAPYLLLAFINVLTALGAAWLVFGVPFRGSLVLLLVESLLYILVSLALGVFVSTRAASQRAAMLGAVAGLLMPSTLLSGMIFPIHSMPGWLQPVTNIVPATWFIEIARGVMLKGVGLGHLWQETLILALMAVVLTVASVRNFDTRLA
ncbi:MAG: ABC transporter permease [Gemmatimonadales bacterium]|jgi:ABC-2 type transport system permease protein